jgi:hypothetical protein
MFSIHYPKILVAYRAKIDVLSRETQSRSIVFEIIWAVAALTSPTNGGRSIGIVRSWTQATECVCNGQCLRINFSLILRLYDVKKSLRYWSQNGTSLPTYRGRTYSFNNESTVERPAEKTHTHTHTHTQRDIIQADQEHYWLQIGPIISQVLKQALSTVAC